MISNPLFDTEFLNKLIEQKKREIFARITALTIDELPIEYIEGKVTGGSINIDGSSAVRRTCNLTMIAQDVNINEFYWGLKNKFKLEIGLKNDFNSFYPEIIWFKQGLYVITSFNTSQSTNNYNISISGKDKMCLLNGDLAGTLPHMTDFGIEEYYDSTTGITTYTSIPIKKIIREAVQNFGNELAHNIIINDIEDAGLELLEYRGDTPLYLFREINSDQFLNMTLNGNQLCYYFLNGKWIKTTINDSANIIYDNLVDLEGELESTTIKLDISTGTNNYKIAKFEYGSIPGYRLTDLVYAGDLIANVGETLTSVLDKIKNMLGEFEYFYNLDGKFVFQKKRNYIDVPWNSIEKGNEIYADASANKSSPIWSFSNSQLISAFQNTPNLLNLRNDFAVWGTKKTVSGSELDIHMRYAIDVKPTIYTSLIDGVTYTSDEWDWRELIYRMALDYRKYYHDDDFLYNLAQANPQYPNGRTGYEQYYTDIEGFWRILYNPNPDIKYNIINYNNIVDNKNLYIQYAYRPATLEELQNLNYDDVYVLYKDSIYPFSKGACHLEQGQNYFYLDTEGKMSATSDKNILNQIDITKIYLKNTEPFNSINNENFYVKVNEESTKTEDFQVFKYDLGTNDTSNINDYIRYIDLCFKKAINENNQTLYIKEKIGNKIYTKYEDIAEELQFLYYKDGQYQQYIITEKDIDNYGKINPGNISLEKIYYFSGYYDYYNDSTTNNYWAKIVNDNPENLLFWFDFLDADGSDIAKYSVPVVGSRTKAINDKDVKSIYYREIPTTIFQSGEEVYEHQTGYTYVQLQNTMENLFTISSKGKSAKERIEELLYNHSYCIESVNITAIPVYHLEPNSRILVKDDNSKINGEYIVNKLTIPLTYNGTMTITATKAVSNII